MGGIAVAAGLVIAALPSDAGTAPLPAAGTTYTLRVERSDLCLDVTDGSRVRGARLQQWGCAPAAGWQQFHAVAAERGLLALRNVGSGLCVAAPDGSTTSGRQVVQESCDGERTNQLWSLKRARRGTIQVVNANSGLCLSDLGASTTPGAAVIQETCTNNSNKRWTFTAVTAAPAAPSASPGTPRPTATAPTATAPTATAPAATAPPSGRTVTGVTSADLVVAPGGSDGDPGTLARPLATLAKAVSVVRPGQVIALRGGVYRPTATVRITTSGTASARITLSNYASERPVLDLGAVPATQWGVDQRADHWTVQGLEIRNARNHPYVCSSCRQNVFRRLNSHDNQSSGFTLRGENTIGNQILDSDFHHNHDDATRGQNADGIDVKFGSGVGNVVKGVRLYANADDGIDLWSFTSPVTIDGTWAYGNGVNRWGIRGWEGNGNGFKLGGGRPVPPVAHVVTDSKAWDNTANGYTENSNAGRLRLQRNTAFRNGGAGFFFRDSAAALTGNLDLANGDGPVIGDRVDETRNSWNGGGRTVVSGTDPAVAQGARRPDGSLPATAFLTDVRRAYGARATG
ncbi:RICIN domain-containing protein [Actinoplanes sp. NPDC051346]|uniref:RICIN domain-containing protein n=1 Tax=Actinoplanes sp. NPDC051346 TaxID=3155048 RepID=UPI00342FA949